MKQKLKKIRDMTIEEMEEEARPYVLAERKRRAALTSEEREAEDRRSLAEYQQSLRLMEQEPECPNFCLEDLYIMPLIWADRLWRMVKRMIRRLIKR